MAARKMPRYEVVSGCIQEGRQIFVAGQEYIPPSAEVEKELLADGVIVRARPVVKQRSAGSTQDGAADSDIPPDDDASGSADDSDALPDGVADDSDAETDDADGAADDPVAQPLDLLTEEK